MPPDTPMWSAAFYPSVPARSSRTKDEVNLAKIGQARQLSLAAPRWVATIARLMRNLENSQKLLVDSARPYTSPNRQRSPRWRFGLLALLFALTGCGSGTPALTPVYGKVAVN